MQPSKSLVNVDSFHVFSLRGSKYTIKIFSQCQLTSLCLSLHWGNSILAASKNHTRNLKRYVSKHYPCCSFPSSRVSFTLKQTLCSLCVWLVSVSLMPGRSIHVKPQNTKESNRIEWQRKITIAYKIMIIWPKPDFFKVIMIPEDSE